MPEPLFWNKLSGIQFQKIVWNVLFLLWPNLHHIIGPTCIQVFEIGWPNLHWAIVFRGESFNNGITSCDPTGALISANPGWLCLIRNTWSSCNERENCISCQESCLEVFYFINQHCKMDKMNSFMDSLNIGQKHNLDVHTASGVKEVLFPGPNFQVRNSPS